MKKSIFVLIMALQLFPLAALDGVLWGSSAEELRVLKTQWFDIIYPPKSEDSALCLFEKADEIYAEIADMYGYEPFCRMPVVLAPGVEQYNAFFAIAPYNHIVIYDVVPTESLLVNSDSLLQTFRHELTHAYTYNLKGNKLKFFSKIIGDVAVLYPFSLTYGWGEGATLTSESADGEGRLNDGFSLQTVRQAKIEGKFPAYADVQGSSDRYPYGSFYYFNGSFDEWLQKTYGMQKYAQFWYTCVNAKQLLAGTAFYKVYGLSINKAWKKFKDELYVPDVPKNPVEAGQCYDFFEKTLPRYSSKNDGDALYSCLSAADDSLFYMDSSCNAVYSASFGERVKTKKLFTKSGLNHISASRDGRFIALQYSAQNSGTVKEKVSIYDCRNKVFFDTKDTSRLSPSVICRTADGKTEYFLVSTKFNTQKTKVLVEKIIIDEKTGRISALKTVNELNMEKNVYPFSYADVQNGSFAFIKADSLVFSICTCPLEGDDVFEYKMPDSKMRLRGLSFDGNSFLFSWAKKDTLPRLGIFNPLENKFYLQKDDVSGGVHFPVHLNNVDMQNFYIGKFYRQNRLFCFDDEMLNAKMQVCQAEEAAADEEVAADVSSTAVPVSASGAIPSSIQVFPYDGTDYLFKGILIPFSVCTSQTYTSDFTSKSQYLPFGLTFVTGTPWTSGNTTRYSIGYGIQTNSFGALVQYSGGTDTSLLRYSFEGSSEFDFKGWKQSELSGGASVYIPFARTSKIYIFDSALCYLGKDIQDINLYSYNDAGITFSNAHYAGFGKYERTGFSVTQAFVLAAFKNLYAKDGIQNPLVINGNLTLELNFYIPKLIPLNCKSGFVYNLPLKTSVSVFPYDALSKKSSGGTNSTNICFENSVLNFDLQTLLFSAEIQKAIPVISAVFINEAALILHYNGAFAEENAFSWGFCNALEHSNQLFSGKTPYKSLLELKLQLGLTPNVGVFTTSSFRFDFYGSVMFNFYKNSFSGGWGLTTTF